jgi:white-opaque regulator 2
MKINELVDLGGAAPPRYTGAKNVPEIIKIYYEVYMPGLTAFFETQWFNFREHSVSILRDNQSITNLFAQFLEALESVKTTDPADMGYSGDLETRLIWQLTSLLKSAIPPNVSNSHRPVGDIPHEGDPIEARNRLLLFEALLSGDTLPLNPLMRPPPNNLSESIRGKELAFWWQMGEFLRLPSANQRQNSLSQMRALLDGRENRDLLYSLAVLRELAPQYPAGYENDAPQHLDEGDPRNRLIVATRFVQNEATTAGGTTNVVRRFAELGIKAFVFPAVNIVRT